MGPGDSGHGCCCRANAASSRPSSGYLIDGYSEFADFDGRELVLIEPLRTLRACCTIRPGWRGAGTTAFPANFPWFNSQRYWRGPVLALREQQAALQEAPLRFRQILQFQQGFTRILISVLVFLACPLQKQ